MGLGQRLRPARLKVGGEEGIRRDDGGDGSPAAMVKGSAIPGAQLCCLEQGALTNDAVAARYTGYSWFARRSRDETGPGG